MMEKCIMFLWDLFPELIAAFLGTLGFSLMFKMKSGHLLFVSINGLLVYAIYMIASFFGLTEFVSAFLATLFAALMAELLARALKAPTVIFVTTILVPIVPGSGLYYSMRYLLLQDVSNFVQRFKSMCFIFAGMMCGIILVSSLMKLVMALLKVKKEEKQMNH